MSHDPTYELTEDEILEKLTDRCRKDNPNISSNIDSILSSATLQDWIRELRSITDHLLTVLGSFEDIEKMVSKQFIFDYHRKSLAEDEQSHPEIDVIAELAELENYAENAGGYDSEIFPIKSLKDLREKYKKYAIHLREF